MYFWGYLTKRKKRRGRLIDHNLRKNGLFRMDLQGSVWSKNRVKRLTTGCNKQIQKDVGCSNYVGMKDLAQDRLS